MKMKKALVKSFFLLLTLALFPFCEDESPRATIPFAPVRFQVDLNGMDHVLRNPLAFKLFTDQDRRTSEDRFGYSGVFLVSEVGGKTLFAYDLCCPHEKSKEVRVVPSDDGTATCPACGSIFITMYGFGTVESGPSKEPLQQYRVYPIPNQLGAFQVAN